MPLELTPLELDGLSPRLRKVLDPGAPEALRGMAAKGSLPLPPDELVTVLYQMTTSAAPEPLRATAKDALGALPDTTVQAALAAALDPRVLHGLTVALQSKGSALLADLSLHAGLHEDTLAWLAAHADAATAERISNNHARILNHPAVIAALYRNPSTPQNALDRLLELAYREKIDLEPFGIQVVDPAELLDGPGLDPETFAQVLAGSAAEAESEHANPTTDLHPTLPHEEEPDASKRVGPLWQQVQRMNTAQKVRLASLGGREARDLLIKDNKRVIYMATIRNPRITPSDAQKYATNRSLSQDVISYIASERRWTRHYPVIVNLLNNPKCPHGEAARFVKELRPNDLQKLQKNKNIPTQLARAAAALYKQRTGG